MLPAIRSRKDTKLLTSYLVTMWSEWDCAGEWAFEGMCEVLKGFCRDGDEALGECRKDLLARLNLVLEELGKGLEHLRGRHLDMQPDEFKVIKERYREMKRILVLGTVYNGVVRTG